MQILTLILIVSFFYFLQPAPVAKSAPKKAVNNADEWDDGPAPARSAAPKNDNNNGINFLHH